MARPQKISDEDVLKRACEIFWQKTTPSIREIEAALDLKATAIYRRFPSKDALLAASIDHYIETIVAPRTQKMLHAANNPVEGLRNYFEQMLIRKEGEDFFRGCLLTNIAVLGDNSDQVREALARGFGFIERAIQIELDRAAQDGILDPSVDTKKLAALLFTSMQGLLALTRSGVSDVEKRIETVFESVGLSPSVDR